MASSLGWHDPQWGSPPPALPPLEAGARAPARQCAPSSWLVQLQLWLDSWHLDQGMWQKQLQWFSVPLLVPLCLLSPTHAGTITVIMSGIMDNNIVRGTWEAAV